MKNKRFTALIDPKVIQVMKIQAATEGLRCPAKLIEKLIREKYPEHFIQPNLP